MWWVTTTSSPRRRYRRWLLIWRWPWNICDDLPAPIPRRVDAVLRGKQLLHLDPNILPPDFSSHLLVVLMMRMVVAMMVLMMRMVLMMELWWYCIDLQMMNVAVIVHHLIALPSPYSLFVDRETDMLSFHHCFQWKSFSYQFRSWGFAWLKKNIQNNWMSNWQNTLNWRKSESDMEVSSLEHAWRMTLDMLNVTLKSLRCTIGQYVHIYDEYSL